MKNKITKVLTTQLAAAFSAAGYDPGYGEARSSDRPDLCQYQCNGALAAAKQYKRNPMEIAREVSGYLTQTDTGITVETVAPGFININVPDSMLADRLNAMLNDERLTLPLTDKPKRIVLDYGGPNSAKPLHVGHLRPAIIGDAMRRILDFLGYDTISDVHLGDWGLPMGMVIASILEHGDLSVIDDASTLNEIYPTASARARTDDVFRAEAERITRELQQGNPEYHSIWRRIRDVSAADAKANYDLLNLLEFDYWYGESDAQSDIPELIERLEQLGLLHDSADEKIINVEEETDTEPMPPVRIIKKDGGELYATTDLATILQRERDFKPNEIWYFADARQSLHFKQVFRVAQLADLSDALFSHIGFGTINGPDGKPFKSRDGGVMSLTNLYGEVYGRFPDPKIASAIIRVADMQNHPTKDYRFDLERFSAAEGKTGPYLQYTATRVASILAKSNVTDAEAGVILAPVSDAERNLALALDSAEDGLVKAYMDKAPSALCETLFDLAAKMNSFIAVHHIISEPDPELKRSRLALLTLVRRMIILYMGLLGVEAPDRM